MSLRVNFTNFHVFSDYIEAVGGGDFISNVLANLYKYSKSCINFIVSSAIFQKHKTSNGKRKGLQLGDVEAVKHLAIGMKSYVPLTVETKNGTPQPVNEKRGKGRPPATKHKYDTNKKNELEGNSVNYQTPYQY